MRNYELTPGFRFEFKGAGFWERATFLRHADDDPASIRGMLTVWVTRDADGAHHPIRLFLNPRGFVRTLPEITYCEGCETDVQPLTNTGFCPSCQQAGIAAGKLHEVGRYV